jgi:predicted transcriptional regulator
MFNFFGHKKRINELKIDVQDSFNSVKKDFNKVGEWIKHLDDKHSSHNNDISEIKDQILDIQNDLIEIKDFISFFGPQLSKHQQTGANKQIVSDYVQTPVQTPVQTGVLYDLTVMERAIVWALLNSEMKLSYEDLAALLGKNKSTIRGQINTIRQKNKNIILESKNSSGKKRLYVPDEIKASIIKNIKIKVKSSKRDKND